MLSYLRMLDYSTVRKFTEGLCLPLEPDDHIVQPHPFVSPPKWHLGHTTWLFETFCLSHTQAFDPSFAYVFNSYYESLGARVSQENRGALSRPTLSRVLDYRRAVDDQILSCSKNDPDWSRLLELGLHHEMQHQELLMMDIKSILFSQPEMPKYSSRELPPPSTGSLPDWIEVPGGLYEVGGNEETFSYDNEKPRHRVFLENFSVQEQLITNEEYLDFMKDDGYERPELWLADGWRWLKESHISRPMYWLDVEREYSLTGVGGLQLKSPVSHVSFYEADAFARWRGCRLPTEFEWEVAFIKSPCSSHWQWTSSAYLPYPGYRPYRGPLSEYNGKFMSGQMVLRGGSFATPDGHYRPTYRNFFPPEMRWQFSSIRLAR